MTDSDYINPFEAPKQPTVSSDPTISAPIRYKATPTIGDLNSALRSTFVIIPVCILLSVLLLSVIVLSLKFIFDGGTVAQDILPLFCVVLFGSLLAMYLRFKIFPAKRHLRLNPRATAPLTGELTNEGLLLQSENRVSWTSHDRLVSCNVKNNQLSLCHEPQGVVVTILPKRGFGNPDQAIRFLKFQANKFSEVNMSEPLSGPSMVGDQPADAIAFGGVVNVGDLKTSPLETIRKRSVIRMLIWLLFLVAIVIPVVGFAFNSLAMLIAAVAIFLICFSTIRKIRSASNSNDLELPLIAIQGWLNEQEIALLHNVGHSRSGWLDFKSVGFNDACIWLHAHGGQDRFVLLPRRFFADDSQWQTAVEIAASHSAK